MKKIFIYSFILVLLFSCSNSQKIIENYLEEEIVQNSQTKNILFKDKGSVNRVFKVFRQTKMQYKDSTYIISGSKRYTDKDFIGFKEKYKNDTLKEFWNNNNFKNLNLKILPQDSISNYIKSFKGKDFSFNINYYVISKLLKNESENIALFSIMKYSNKKGILYRKVIVYKKEDEKWIKVEEINNLNTTQVSLFN